MRNHANNWTAEHQRAFIAALATTGNVRPAARSIGRYPNGAERLRKHPRGKSFAEAWENALDLYKERELGLLRESLGELDEEHRKATETTRLVAAEMDYHRPVDDPGAAPDAQDVIDARNRIAERLWNARRLFLAEVACREETRMAWELLSENKVDWDRALDGKPQDDEIEAKKHAPIKPPGAKSADVVVVNEVLGAGLPDV